MNGYVIFEDDEEWMFIDRDLINVSTSSEHQPLERLKRDPAIAYRPSEKDIGEYERLSPYFLAVRVYNGMRGKSQ